MDYSTYMLDSHWTSLFWAVFEAFIVVIRTTWRTKSITNR